ncbi:ParB/RepB/Spo0J family partition protein [Lachnospiraceae bacterium MD308]|nr:ParB/RepB/Spo0J family partition protein [Lachnospiraceae bacterium MD308]
MSSKSAGKVKLKSFDDLFGTQEVAAGETVTSVPLSQLHTFKDHPFRVLDDEKMQETVDSVKKYGVLIPGIVRPHPENGYEVVAGHRRWRACELVGLEEMPVIIREMDDDTAVVIMVDTNIQREDILPSEKAKAYRMKYEAMKHQGSKGDKYTADAIGEAAGDSGRTVQRYIRLSELVQELLDYVDDNKIPMVVGEKLSYLQKEEQEWVTEAIGNSSIFPSKEQADKLRELSEAGELTEGEVYAVLIRKEKGNVKVTIPQKKIRNYFPESYSKEQIENVIYTLLENWSRKEGGTIDAGNTV